jgi:hypothetical protein
LKDKNFHAQRKNKKHTHIASETGRQSSPQSSLKKKVSTAGTIFFFNIQAEGESINNTRSVLEVGFFLALETKTG